MSSNDIRFHIKKLDQNEDITINDWEVEFIESIVKNVFIPLSEKRKNKCIDILNKYSTGEYYAR